ncbi:regulator of G-protein signaling 16-like [Discoglossus pictus]
MCKGLADIQCTCLEWVKDMRSSIGTLLHKVEAGHHAVTTGWYSQKKKTNSRCCVKECMQWKESFNQLLNSKDGITVFRTFLQTEFSEENLEFWVACEEYRKTRSSSKLPAKAQAIFEKFLHSGATKEVNIDHQTRELTRQQILVASRSCFDEAQEQARILMEKDSYPRFLKSPIYRELLPPSTLRTVKLSFT